MQKKYIILGLGILLLLLSFVGLYYEKKHKNSSPTITPTQVIKNYEGVAIQPFIVKTPDAEQNTEFQLLGVTEQGYGVFLNYKTKGLILNDAGNDVLKEALSADSRIKEVTMAKLFYTNSLNVYKVLILTDDSYIHVFNLILNQEKAALEYEKGIKIPAKGLYLEQDLVDQNIAWIVSMDPDLYSLGEFYEEEAVSSNQFNAESGKDEESSQQDKKYFKVTLLNLNTYKFKTYESDSDYVPFAKLSKDYELVYPYSPMGIKTLSVLDYKHKFKVYELTECTPDEDYMWDFNTYSTNLVLLKNSKCLPIKASAEQGNSNKNVQNNVPQTTKFQPDNKYIFARVVVDNNKVVLKNLENNEVLQKIANAIQKFDVETERNFLIFGINNNLYILDATTHTLYRYENALQSGNLVKITKTDLPFLEDRYISDMYVLAVNEKAGWIDILINNSILIRVYDKITT